MNKHAKPLILLALVTFGVTEVQAAGDYPQPDICDRDCWGARDPAGNPGTMSGLNRGIIHHTAISENYSTESLEESKAMVRGIQNYHMDVNGWSDVGYHFLADKLGYAFEGREGSINTLVRGAHDGVNDQSFGFSMMGYFHNPHDQIPTEALRCTIYDLISWRIPDNFDGLGSSTYNGKETGYLGGHRDVGSTACPGDLVYDNYIGTDYEGGEAREEVYARIETGAGFLCEGGPQCCPSAPTLESVTADSNSITISWQDIGEVVSYQLYVSSDGESFSSPIVLPSGQNTYVDSGLSGGTSRYYYVTALGTSTESAPSDIYGGKTNLGNGDGLLIVDGNDRWRSQSENPSGNNHNFSVLAAQAINDFPFDTADNGAILDGLIDLSDYKAVVWLLGEESTTYETVSIDEQALVEQYLDNGGNLFISGAEIGWDLVERGSDADSRFYEDVFKAQYMSDDGGQYVAYTQVGGLFEGLGPFDFSDSEMDVEFPDVIAGFDGARVDLYYTSTGAGDAVDRFAGISYAGDYNLVYFGFPFESISNVTSRQEIMGRISEFFGLTSDVSDVFAHVESIRATINTTGRDRVISQVTVVNEAGRPVADVLVSGTVSGDVNQEVEGLTNRSGVATISTAPTNQNISSATFCVTALSGAAQYDSDANLMDCVSP